MQSNCHYQPEDFMGRLRSSRDWCVYFQRNARDRIEIPWERGAEVSDEERDAIAASVQEFQLGESSDGRRSLAIARRYAEKSSDRDYPEALALFFREEGLHAEMLARFLGLAGLPLLTHSWRDSAFRQLRRCFNLEVLLLVLLIAELIAKVYYRALRTATRSDVLRRICSQILRDEKPHVQFHLERLARMRRHRPRWLNRLAVEAHRTLFLALCFLVWLKHGRAMRRGGFNWRRYWRHCRREFNDAARGMDPRAYAAEDCLAAAYFFLQ
jgi:hypothetical protein